jgi:hypothetical protein
MKRKLSKILGIGLTIALLTSLLVTAVPASALTQPTVVLTPATAVISAVTTYTLTFTSGGIVSGTAGDQYVITFPAGTTVPVAPVTTVEATVGIGGAAFGPVAPLSAVGVPATGVVTVTPAVGNIVGNGALVQIIMAGITNPATPGTAYTISVKSQTGAAVPIEAAVTSAAYAINAPGLAPLAGLVVAYNAAGIKMSQAFGGITAASVAAGVGGKVEVGAGTYNEAVAIVAAGQTIVSVDGAGKAIITNAVATAVTAGALAGQVTTIDGFTFTPAIAGVGMLTLNTAGAGTVKVQNCTLASGTSGAVRVLGGTGHVVDKCTITAAASDGVNVAAGAFGVTLSNSTVNVGATGTAVNSVGTGVVVVDKNTITGTAAGAKGISLTGVAPVTTISNNTMKTLSNALTLNAAGLIVTGSGNTIDACGATGSNAIVITLGTMNFNNNTVSNTAGVGTYGISLAGAGAVLTAYFNNFTGNTLNVLCAAGGVATVDHNWWGDKAGPAVTSITGVAVAPVLSAKVNTGNFVVTPATSIAAKATTGIDVACYVLATGLPAAPGIIAVSKYDTNPLLVTPPIVGTGKVLGYYDVYVGVPGAVTSVQIKIYGTVTAYTKLYYAASLGGSWAQPDSWGVSVAGGYVFATITNAAPTVVDLAGMPFALVEDKTIAAPAITALAGGSPVIGAYDVSIEPMFTWGIVPGAIRYEIALSEDPTFTIIEWSYNVDNNFYKVDEALRYDTTYYWRVRGVLGEPFQEAGAWKTPSTPWATGIFTTEMEPAPAVEPIVVDPVKPIVNVEVPPTKITVEPAGQAIPTYILWVIVIVGAVLVIALIVLIVRTRRVV